MKSLLFLFFMIYSNYLFAQKIVRELIANSGEDFVSNNIELSWSLGEISVETYTRNYILSQGFFQGENLVLGIKKTIQPNKLTTYPNPFVDFVKIIGIDNLNTPIIIYNSTGQIMLEQNLPLNGIIDLSSFQRGIYYLMVELNNSEERNQTIKLIKLN